MVANGLTVDEIRTSIGADSLSYISLEQLVEATGVANDLLCRACFDGVYPIDLPDPELIGKHLLEVIERKVSTDAEGLDSLVAGGGASDALLHP